MRLTAKNFLIIAFLIIGILYLSISGLVAAKSFLAPLSIAILLGMVLVPVTKRLEKWGFGRGWASFVSVLIALVFFVGLFFIVAMQVNSIAQDWPKIKQRLEPKVEQAQQWIAKKTGIKPAQQEQFLKSRLPGGSGASSAGSSDTSAANPQQNGASASGGPQANQSQASASSGSSGGSGALGSVGQVLLGFFSFLGTSLLTFVYMFFMLLYRNKVDKSVLRFAPSEKRPKAAQILRRSVKLSQSYLAGRLLLILFLAVLYAIGLSVSGIKHAILVSIIAAVLSLIPYVGNIIGFFLAMGMAAFSGGSTMAFLGVVVTFGVAQFVESYVLEPYVVGHKVDLNPLMTIIVVVLGGAVWGITGMIIAIPVFGILKILFDNIPILNPLGYALGEEGIDQKESFMDRAMKKVTGKK